MALPSSSCWPETPAVTLPAGGHHGRDPLQCPNQIPAPSTGGEEKARPAIPGKLCEVSCWDAHKTPGHNVSLSLRETQRQYLVRMGGRGGRGLVAEHAMQLCYFNMEIPFSPTHVHFAPTYYSLALSCLVIFEVAWSKGLFWVRETEVISCHGRGRSVRPQAKGTTPLGM